MTICIITHVVHGVENDQYFAYTPYVKEMNIWFKYVEKVVIVAPMGINQKSPIQSGYKHDKIDFYEVPGFDIMGVRSKIKTIVTLPRVLKQIYLAMKQADHIHLRCPGNMGLLGCIVQILFPKKPKTAKYAGNWDASSKQPLSYRLQRTLLRNTFLTKNMQVLVYGKWADDTKNIKPFFTASYYEHEKADVRVKKLEHVISFVFVGTLSNGKQPLYAVQLIEALHKNNNNVTLTLYGEGIEKPQIEDYIKKNNLAKIVTLKGNQNQEVIQKAYEESHFVILPSLSEGWPKAVAEGMFWGCLPIATPVSCLPNMLDNGRRGILLNLDFEKDVDQIQQLLCNDDAYQDKVFQAITWSRQYTLDLFELEIKHLLQE